MGEPGEHRVWGGVSSTQLDATSNVPGTFAYSPAAGTVLEAGTQTLVGHLHTYRRHRL